MKKATSALALSATLGLALIGGPASAATGTGTLDTNSALFGCHAEKDGTMKTVIDVHASPAVTETVTVPAVTKEVTTPAVTKEVTTPAVTETVIVPAVTETVTIPAVYETEYEFAHKNPNKPHRWETDPNWNANSNPNSVGWKATGVTRKGDLLKPETTEIKVITPEKTETVILTPEKTETVILAPEKTETVIVTPETTEEREVTPAVEEKSHQEPNFVTICVEPTVPDSTPTNPPVTAPVLPTTESTAPAHVEETRASVVAPEQPVVAPVTAQNSVPVQPDHLAYTGAKTDVALFGGVLALLGILFLVIPKLASKFKH